MSLLHQIALTFIPKIGDATARALVTHFGSAAVVFQASKADLKEVPGVGDVIAGSILNHTSFPRAEQEIKFIEKYKITALAFTDARFPKRLNSCYDAPFLLYYKGSADLNDAKLLSIVGTRNASDYGKDICGKLIRDLKPHDPVIVSGLAYGIDSIAHKESVKNDMRTVGVLAHGLDRIYPSQNRSLAEHMLERGGLISEYPSGTNPDRENFPKRNRIIAGMSDATIVMEASIKGGALITAEIANSYNRDVFAFPGRVDYKFSEGCNFLIKTNRANLISGIKDLEYILDWTALQQPCKEPQLKLALNLSPEEKRIVDLLAELGQVGVDDLALKANLPLSRLAVTVLSMEMQGIVVAMPGKTYKLA